MRHNKTTWLALTALALLASFSLTHLAAKPLPPEVIKVWKDAGAELEKWEPRFIFRKIEPGALTMLPDPGVPFRLSIWNFALTDAGLAGLAKLKSIERLDFGDRSGITDTGLKELTHLKNLQSLSIRGSRVTDAGLKELAGLTSLRFLELDQRLVTDAGLKHLAALTNLQELHLHSTKVTGEGIKELSGLKSFRILSL